MSQRFDEQASQQRIGRIGARFGQPADDLADLTLGVKRHGNEAAADAFHR